MRRVVVVLLALCACESRYGTYFNVDGDANEIRFDHVELFFGKNGMSGGIATPNGARMGKVFQRDLDPSDAWDVPRNGDGSLATESTYWLSINDQNRELGYVAALAYDTTSVDRFKPVGVGEVLGFVLEDGVVNKYDIELEKPIFGLEVWGMEPSCFSWTRQRSGQLSTIAVLGSPDDADCDGLVATADCNDACPTGAMSCNPDAAICGGPATCGIGCAKNGLCAIEACAPPAACMDPCAKLLTFEDKMKCASDTTHDHLQIDVNMTGGTPCVRSFHVLPYQTPCFNPHREWLEPLNDNWDFTVAPSTNTTGEVTITMDGLASQSFSNDHHMLISCDPKPSTFSRWSFIIGIQPGVSGCNASQELNYTLRTASVGTPFYCP